MLATLSLVDFRNKTRATWKFSPTTTLIIGPNGAGKTNLLEAIWFLATGKSFRAAVDRETIAFGKELTRVKGEIVHGNEKETLELFLTLGEVMGIKTPLKRYMKNGVSKRSIDFVGALPCVLFWPQDLELVVGTPSLRRRYIDFVLMQTDWHYRRCLLSYEKGLRQRNMVLAAIRDQHASERQLLFWDELLIKEGSFIAAKRESYVQFLNTHPTIAFQEHVGYHVHYDKSVLSYERLQEHHAAEIAAAVTLVGPHRDDFILHMDTRELARFGSRGQQRVGVLWLKMGELGYIEQVKGEKPLLLLDDVFSELDRDHEKIIFSRIEQQQTILTTTDKEIMTHIGVVDTVIQL